MLSSLALRRTPLAVAAATKLAPAIGTFPTNISLNNTQLQQVRTVTKKREHRMAKRKRKEELAAVGIFPPKPHMYIARDTPVINAVSREERNADSKLQDERVAKELQEKLEVVNQAQPLMRFGFDDDGLVMSDRVRKLFDLQNGSQKEVVKAQKQRGMELFQMREGDTGSSGVQGEFC